MNSRNWFLMAESKTFPAYLGLIVLLAFLVRQAFFNGPLGSDDIVYLGRSLDVAKGLWTSANYNGALRYGYNIPEGFLLYLFGLNLFTANLWSLLCSLIEISLVFWFAWKYIGQRAAVFSALFLACLPLHVAVSTRIHADPVVAMFLTLSFVTFYKAERESNKFLYFSTGLALGAVFWTKELAAITFFPFLIYPVLIRQFKSVWIYLIFGGITMLLGHFALMMLIAGDSLHAFKTVLGQVSHSFIGGADQSEDSPWYYFRYLFFDIKHTWLTPILALLIFVKLPYSAGSNENQALKYSAFWLISLLLVLSFLPVSLSPLKFAMKQSNYLSLFLAPIAIIAGSVTARIPNKFAWWIAGITIAGGLALSALEQQAYQVFTANSRGLLSFSKNHPEQKILGSVNNSRIACFYEVLNGNDCADRKIFALTDIPEKLQLPEDNLVYTVIDSENNNWGGKVKKFDKAPECWKELDLVVPASTGNSHHILEILVTIMTPLSANVAKKLQEFNTPKPARIYMVNSSNLWCEGIKKLNAD